MTNPDPAAFLAAYENSLSASSGQQIAWSNSIATYLNFYLGGFTLSVQQAGESFPLDAREGDADLLVAQEGQSDQLEQSQVKVVPVEPKLDELDRPER